jgi:hypothetical protein
MGKMRLRCARELDSSQFHFPRVAGLLLIMNPAATEATGRLVAMGRRLGPEVVGVTFHFSDEDARQLGVDFMGMRPEKVLLLLLSLWTVCMGGIDGGTAHSVGLGDTIGGVFSGPFGGLDFLALLRPGLLACEGFILIILEVHHHEATTQPLLLRKGGGGGGVSPRDPLGLVLFPVAQSPMDVFTDNIRNSLENFCSSWSVEVCDPIVKESGKYTHPALYRSILRVCQARTNEDHLLLSSRRVQRGTRREHSPASSILFRLHQAIL